MITFLGFVFQVSEDLSSELSGVKAAYERAVEQVNLLENGKRIVNQQQHVLEQEIGRLEHDLQNTKDVSVDAHIRAHCFIQLLSPSLRKYLLKTLSYNFGYANLFLLFFLFCLVNDRLTKVTDLPLFC